MLTYQIEYTERMTKMDMNIDNIEPAEVFGYFKEIAAIPHGSGNVKRISDYLMDFAGKHGLKARQDAAYNVIIWKDATAGMENAPGVIIQGHMDMVAVSDADCRKNMETEGLELAVDGDYLYAKHTSLGADDGIAVAYALALLASDDIPHPPLEAIFTVDEEIGMLGASAIEPVDVKGRIMLNVDSEDEGVLTVGCAGGATVEYSLAHDKENMSGERVDVAIEGLTGGHSGTQIICQRANAIVLLGRLLSAVTDGVKVCSTSNVKVISVYGGEKDNAIAKLAGVSFCVAAEHKSALIEIISTCEKTFQAEYATTDPDMALVICENGAYEGDVYTDVAAELLTTSLTVLPYGVYKLSYHIKGLVQTSLNYGILTDDGSRVTLTFSVRSSVSSEKYELIDKIKRLAKLTGATISVNGEYPAWEYRQDSRLREVCVDTYREMFGSEPVVETIHAGVECGILAEKLPGLDCISMGPDILDIHTTNEKLSISSAKRTWDYIKEILRRL